MVPELRAFALLKTVRLMKIQRWMKKYSNRSFGPLLRVVIILTFWLLCAHWVACGFFVIGWSTCAEYSVQPQAVNSTCHIRGSKCNGNWITEYWPQLSPMCVSGRLPADAGAAFGVSVPSMHMRTLAWALATMSSMGYGM